MKKKIPTLLALLALPLASGLTACNSNEVTIGILQPVQHPALDAAREGFTKAIEESGVKAKIVYRNAGGNDADQNTYAKDLVDTSKLVLGIGTGATQALKGAEDNAGYSKPLLFTAVTDPVEAGLVKSKENTEGFVCGTTDANPVEEQIALVKEFKADASKVGIMYTQTEINSKVQADQAEAAIQAAGMTAVIKTCSNSSDIKATALALADAGVDAIYVPTDNNIAANMNAINDAATTNHVLVVCGEENMLKSGGHVTLSIDYFGLGFDTGKMAAEILKGNKKPTDFPVVPVAASACSYVLSNTNLTAAGLTLPEAMLNAHTWRDINA